MKHALSTLFLAILLGKCPVACAADSLILALDTARIDNWIRRGTAYMLKGNRDSAIYFQTIACLEAEKYQYINGLAQSYVMISRIEKFFDDNFPAAEAYAWIAKDLYDRTGNKKHIEQLYEQLWHSLFAQSKYEQAAVFATKKLNWCIQEKDSVGTANMLSVFSSINLQTGEFDNAFSYMQQSWEIAAKSKDSALLTAIQGLIGTLYRAMGDYPAALSYYHKAYHSSIFSPDMPRHEVDCGIWVVTEYAELYAISGKYDSAWKYYAALDTARMHMKDLRVYLASTGELFLLQKEYTKALDCFDRSLKWNRQLNDRSQVIRTELGIAKSYAGLRQYGQAIRHASQAIAMSAATQAKQSLHDAYSILSCVYDELKMDDSANHYFRMHTVMKDSVDINFLKGKIAASNYENKLANVNRENAIIQQRVKQQQHQLSRSELTKNGLVVGIILLFLFGIIIFANIMLRRKNEHAVRKQLESELTIQRLESKKIQMEMREKASELEMAALRAQMNPHFIFNCLNAINHYILSNDTDLASEYLTKFSRLIRLVLQSSSTKMVALADELLTLGLYIELEQLRFKKHFDYVINTDERVDKDSVLIPPMLLQPFVENAIWHGLMQSKKKGFLTISISRENERLTCMIEDNGIGRKKSSELQSKSASYKKSMGIDITANRLKMLFNEDSEPEFLRIIDLFNEYGVASGTRIQIELPVVRTEFSDRNQTWQ